MGIPRPQLLLNLLITEHSAYYFENLPKLSSILESFNVANQLWSEIFKEVHDKRYNYLRFRLGLLIPS